MEVNNGDLFSSPCPRMLSPGCHYGAGALSFHAFSSMSTNVMKRPKISVCPLSLVKWQVFVPVDGRGGGCRSYLRNKQAARLYKYTWKQRILQGSHRVALDSSFIWQTGNYRWFFTFRALFLFVTTPMIMDLLILEKKKFKNTIQWILVIILCLVSSHCTQQY